MAQKEKVKIDVDSHGQQHIIFKDCIINSIVPKGNKELLIDVKSK